MLKYVFLLISPIVALLSACSDQYNIMGNSSVPTYDGNVLYLKVMSGGAPAMAYDSAEVVHGKFGFEGIIDTVCMAQLYMGTSRLLPIVLESGDIQINFTDTEQTVRGGTLNERLYKFLNENARLQNEIQNNTHNMARLIMSGATPAAHLRIERRNEELQDRLDKLWTDFISENSDNVLGPLASTFSGKELIDYQWYRTSDSTAIEGQVSANLNFYDLPDADYNKDAYYVCFTINKGKADEVKTCTCAKAFDVNAKQHQFDNNPDQLLITASYTYAGDVVFVNADYKGEANLKCYAQWITTSGHIYNDLTFDIPDGGCTIETPNENGLYLLRVVTGKGSRSFKFMINK